jgi:hypothetical protein
MLIDDELDDAESAWNGLQRIFGDSHRWTLEAKENLERLGGAIRRLPDDPTSTVH